MENSPHNFLQTIVIIAVVLMYSLNSIEQDQRKEDYERRILDKDFFYIVKFSAKGGSASGGNASNLPGGTCFYKKESSNAVQLKKMMLLNVYIKTDKH